MSLHLFAGLRVRDFEAARPWYERLLGEPTFFPHATEAVWTLAEDRSVFVVEHADGAGNSVVTIFLDDLDAHLAAIAARGLEPDERETYSNGVVAATEYTRAGDSARWRNEPRGAARRRCLDEPRLVRCNAVSLEEPLCPGGRATVRSRPRCCVWSRGASSRSWTGAGRSCSRPSACR